jgi:hypothetical protein
VAVKVVGHIERKIMNKAMSELMELNAQKNEQIRTLQADNKALREALGDIHQCHTCIYSTGLETGDCPDDADGNNPCSAYKLTDKEIGHYMKKAEQALKGTK